MGCTCLSEPGHAPGVGGPLQPRLPAGPEVSLPQEGAAPWSQDAAFPRPCPGTPSPEGGQRDGPGLQQPSDPGTENPLLAPPVPSAEHPGQGVWLLPSGEPARSGSPRPSPGRPAPECSALSAPTSAPPAAQRAASGASRTLPPTVPVQPCRHSRTASPPSRPGCRCSLCRPWALLSRGLAVGSRGLRLALRSPRGLACHPAHLPSRTASAPCGSPGPRTQVRLPGAQSGAGGTG